MLDTFTKTVHNILTMIVVCFSVLNVPIKKWMPVVYTWRGLMAMVGLLGNVKKVSKFLNKSWKK